MDFNTGVIIIPCNIHVALLYTKYFSQLVFLLLILLLDCSAS